MKDRRSLIIAPHKEKLMLKETRLTKIGLGIAATMTAFCVYAANGQPLPAPKVDALTQKV